MLRKLCLVTAVPLILRETPGLFFVTLETIDIILVYSLPFILKVTIL